MKKQDFGETCADLYMYEDEALAKIQEYIKTYNEDLNKLGFKVECRLLWFYADETEDDKVCSTSRREINRNRPYDCQMCVGICPIDCRFTIDEEYDGGISLWAGVSAYSLTILRGFVFKKFKYERIYKKSDKI